MVEFSIMIVGDEQATGRIWAFILIELQCTPVIVNSVAQPLSTLEDTMPDLIVIDIKSRAVSGAEICKALREHIGVPILLLTPINNESHILEVYQVSGDECIINPISPALFQFQSSESPALR